MPIYFETPSTPVVSYLETGSLDNLARSVSAVCGAHDDWAILHKLRASAAFVPYPDCVERGL